MPGCLVPADVRAAVVLKIVSQPAASQRLLVRATRMCTRTSASVQTLSHHAVTTAAHQSLAVLQQAAVLQPDVTRVAQRVATLTQAAALQPLAERVA